MDVLSLFEEFLPNWAKQNNEPIPTKNTDRWYLAWHDFVKTELNSLRIKPDAFTIARKVISHFSFSP